MQKSVVELFAGVGGFRCGLNHIHTVDDTKKPEKWETVWFSQWEPSHKTIQWAHDCYAGHFGTCLDLKGNDTTGNDIHSVDKSDIPDHTLLVGGFPCQSYSIASTLATSKGLEGSKGVLWWDIRDVLEIKAPPFVLLENVDRLLKSPAKQRGRDFGVILGCFRDLGYSVEWRVINAAEYGFQQRRRRTFIFAYKQSTAYGKRMKGYNPEEIIGGEGFFAKSFPIESISGIDRTTTLQTEIGKVSESFEFLFENSGFMLDGEVYTVKTIPDYQGKQTTLGDIMDTGTVADEYFIAEDRLYYTDPEVDHSDETEERLPLESRKTWQYIKGAKRSPRTARNGHEYLYSEGPVPMIDEYDKPARTLLTSEGSFGRSTHLVRDKQTGRIRLLTAEECERIQGFPTGWTETSVVDGKPIPMPTNKRRFMAGNALVVGLIEQMEGTLSQIVEAE